MTVRAIARGNPKYTLSGAERDKARVVVKHLRDNGVSAAELAKEVGCCSSLVHNWYHSAAAPGKKLFPKVLTYYERFLEKHGNVS